MNKPLYLDYNATTPVDPRVLDAMLPYFKEEFGNPSSSSHAYGWGASAAVEKARKQVAQSIGASAKEIFWTSGATESSNLAILGVAGCYCVKTAPCHIITSAVEHKATSLVCEYAEKLGSHVTVLPVDEYGLVTAEQVKAAIKPNTALVTLIMGNNEIGSINPIKEIGQVTRSAGLFFHVDAAQTAGKVPIDVKEMNIDLLSISGHKIYGPKGVGALYVGKEPEVPLKCIMFGGSQESGVRPGTHNVPGIVGLGTALDIAITEMETESQRLTKMRDKFINQILSSIPDAVLNGHPTRRLASNISFSFNGLSSDLFALGLSGLAVSSGSACTSDDGRPSHVLKAIGRPDDLARATVRLGIGRFSKPEDLEAAAQKILKMVEKNKVLSAI